MRPLRSVGLAVALALAVAGCGSDMPSASPSAASAPPSRSQPATAASSPSHSPTSQVRSPSPSPSPSLVIDDLPRVGLAELDATALCDAEPSQRDEHAGESAIPCSDGLELALRDLRTLTKDPVTRLYLQRPACAAVPCSEDELNTAHVTLWTASQAFDVALDARVQTVPPPSIAIDPAWPAPGDATAPAVRRPIIKGAPREVARREPYPYCGRADVGDPPEVLGCFRSAVLAGRPAEMIERAYGTEGGPIVMIYRYAGQGRVILLRHDNSVDANGRAADEWWRDEGAVILGITPLTWSFEPWDGTDAKLSS